jgi:hypothetical protein
VVKQNLPASKTVRKLTKIVEASEYTQSHQSNLELIKEQSIEPDSCPQRVMEKPREIFVDDVSPSKRSDSSLSDHSSFDNSDSS